MYIVQNRIAMNLLYYLYYEDLQAKYVLFMNNNYIYLINVECLFTKVIFI